MIQPVMNGTQFTVSILNIKNPSKQGGTGNFRIETRIGNLVIDENYNFAVIGQAQPTIKLINGIMDFAPGKSDFAGDPTEYKAIMTPLKDLPENIDFRITFPESIYDLSNMEASFCKVLKDDGSNFEGSYYCKQHPYFTNVLFIKGNKGLILAGTNINIYLSNINNPSRNIITDLFQFDIMYSSSTVTIEQDTSVPGLSIRPGKMDLVQLQLYYNLYLPFDGYIREFVLNFKPRNPFISARIKTEFEEILSCTITKGVNDMSTNVDAVCQPEAFIMHLSNFDKYQRSGFSIEYMQIRFKAKIRNYNLPSNQDNLVQLFPVRIYTYLDLDYLILVDSDEDSVATQLQIVPLPNPANCNDCDITFSTTIANTPLDITIVIDIETSYSSNINLHLELPEEIFGVPVCKWAYKGIPGTLVEQTCSLKFGSDKGLLTFYKTAPGDLTGCTGTTGGSSCPMLKITNLKTPKYKGNYIIRALVYGDQGTNPNKVNHI